MPKREDLTGKNFGYLTVISRASCGDGKVLWNCKCKCGNFVRVSTGILNSGHTKSCGCAKIEATIKRNTKHGLSDTRLYSVWIGMKKRCFNKNSKRYADYGGRGISICDEWTTDFKAFYDWSILNGYSEDLTIERKDVNGDYCPENCCWIPLKEQMRNQRKTIYYTLFGITKPLSEWSELAGIKNNRAYQRYKNGNPPFDEKELCSIESKLKNGGI